MKKITLILSLILLGLASCTESKSDALTDQEKENIEQEIRQATQGIADAANNLETDYFREVYWNDDQAILIDPSYGAVDYDTYMDATEEMYSGLEMINFIKDTIMVRVIDENTAYAVFKGSAKGEAKDGTKMGLTDFYASMVFEKVDEQWKVAYTHESFKEEEMMMPTASDSTAVE